MKTKVVVLGAVIFGLVALSIVQWRRSVCLREELIELRAQLEKTTPAQPPPPVEPSLAQECQLAAFNGDLPKLRGLLDAHPELLHANTGNKFRNTALHFAAYNGQLEAVAELLKRGAEVNIRNKEGNTPLHDAINGGKESVVRLLFENGADVQIRNSAGRNAVEHALDRGRPQMAQLIQQLTANQG